MRIATITSGPPTGMQGTERFLATFTAMLRETGAEVAHFHFPQLLPPRPWSVWDRLGWRVPANAGILARRALAAEPPFDLFVAHGLCGWALPPSRTITIYHGCYAGYAEALRGHLPLRDYLMTRYVWGWAERRAGRARVRVALSRSEAGFLRRHYGVEPTHTILNAVDTGYFRPGDRARLREELGLPEGGCVVLFAGSWSYPKGADIVAAAAAALPEEIILLAATNAEPRDVPVPPRVRLYLRQTPGELRRLYQAADLFLFPSRSEACSLALAEAMACGLAPVASRVGAWSEILAAGPELEPGFLPAGAAPEEYAAAIRRLAGDPGRRARLGERAARVARELFAPARFRRDYETLIRESLSAARGEATRAPRRASPG